MLLAVSAGRGVVNKHGVELDAFGKIRWNNVYALLKGKRRFFDELGCLFQPFA
ncbi:hypothetical protein D1872_287280 [compost metagenome]